MGEQIGIVSIGLHHVHIRLLYIEVMPNSAMLHHLRLLPHWRLHRLRLLVLRDMLVMLLSLTMLASTAAPAMVRGGSGVGISPPKLITTAASTTHSTLVVVVMRRVSPRQDLVEVIILEGLPLEHKVGKASADLAKDTPAPCRVPNATSVLGRQVGLHRLHKAYSLSVRAHRKRALHDIIPKWVHHQLPYAISIVELVEVLLPHAVCAPLQTLLHDVRAELLDGEGTNLTDHTLADGVDLVISTNI